MTTRWSAVSIATVSRALNGHSNVTKATREAIEERELKQLSAGSEYIPLRHLPGSDRMQR